MYENGKKNILRHEIYENVVLTIKRSVNQPNVKTETWAAPRKLLFANQQSIFYLNDVMMTKQT